MSLAIVVKLPGEYLKEEGKTIMNRLVYARPPIRTDFYKNVRRVDADPSYLGFPVLQEEIVELKRRG